MPYSLIIDLGPETITEGPFVGGIHEADYKVANWASAGLGVVTDANGTRWYIPWHSIEKIAYEVVL